MILYFSRVLCLKGENNAIIGNEMSITYGAKVFVQIYRFSTFNRAVFSLLSVL